MIKRLFKKCQDKLNPLIKIDYNRFYFVIEMVNGKKFEIANKGYTRDSWENYVRFTIFYNETFQVADTAINVKNILTVKLTSTDVYTKEYRINDEEKPHTLDSNGDEIW